MIESAIYDAQVRHRRREPAHEVHHRLRLAYLDIDRLPEFVAARTGWATHPAPVWFRRRDYLDGTNRPMRDALADVVADQIGMHLPGPVAILTQLRTFGWLFNPLTTYYCFEADGETLAALVLEITNTPWHERFWYVLDAAQVAGRGTLFPKQFHVSPMLPMGLTYRCRAPVPGEWLALRLELANPESAESESAATTGDTSHEQLGVDRPRISASRKRHSRVFDADLTGRRVPLDAPLTPLSTLRSASQTALVSTAIYAHAAVLRARGAPFHQHPVRHPATDLPVRSPEPRNVP